MKRTHVLIAVLALMSMTAAAQVANAQEPEQGISLERVVSSKTIPAEHLRNGRFSAMGLIEDKAESKQTRCMALGKC